MKAVRGTCVLIALAFFVQVFATDPGTPKVSDSGSTLKRDEVIDVAPNTTAVPPTNTTLAPTTTVPTPNTTNATTTEKPTTTAAPTTTTSVPTTTNPPITTTNATTTSTTTTTTQKPTPSPSPNSTTTSSPPTTPSPTPPPHRHFDGLSFLGGMILAAGLIAIGFILWKFYKARTERNYHTL